MACPGPAAGRAAGCADKGTAGAAALRRAPACSAAAAQAQAACWQAQVTAQEAVSPHRAGQPSGQAQPQDEMFLYLRAAERERRVQNQVRAAHLERQVGRPSCGCRRVPLPAWR